MASKLVMLSNRNAFIIGKSRILDGCYGDESNGGGINSVPLVRKTMGISRECEGLKLGGEYSTMTPLQLNQCLDKGTGDQFLLVDLRDSRHYQNGHIRGAISANCTTKLMSKKTLMDWKRSDLDERPNYLLYDQQSDLPAPNSPQIALIEYLVINSKKITFLQGGFDEFKKICKQSFIETSLSKEKLHSYNYSPTNMYTNNSEDILNATASKILPFLFLGNERDSSDLDLLKELQITYILNVTSTSPFYFKNQNRFQYQRLPACDSHMQNLRVLYNDAFSFIDEARYSQSRILVHCWAGVSRSPSIVIAYLLKHSYFSVIEILKFIQSKRSIVAPNIHFMGQLERYYLDLNHGLEKRCADLFDHDLKNEF